METVAVYDSYRKKMMVVEIPSICMIATKEGFCYELDGICKLNADYELKDEQTRKEVDV